MVNIGYDYMCIYRLTNTLGDTPYTYLYKTMEGNTTQNINEHLPMTIIDETETLSAIVVILAI